ncbi:MAG: SDR family NAD(P)-dependent oxidoreductase [Pseudomonadota bacterium]
MAARKPRVIVAGAGAGLGQALLARCQAGGFIPVGLGRSKPDAPVGDFHALDLSDEAAMPKTIAGIIKRHGAPRVVIHNAAELVIRPFVDADLSDYQRTRSSMVQSAILLAQATMQPMVRAGGGAFIVSGATASVRGGARFSAFARAKYALRGLTQSLARESKPASVHVSHVILDDIIDTARSRGLHSLDPMKMMRPDDIAEVYWHLAHQPTSTWTQELDLRPASEGF